MEISLFEYKTLYLRSIPFTRLRQGTDTSALFRSCTTDVRVTAELLDALKSAGFSPTASVGSRIQVKLAIGFTFPGGPRSECCIRARIVNHEILTAHEPESKGDTWIRLTVNFIKDTYHPGRDFVPGYPTHSFRVIRPKGHAAVKCKYFADGTDRISKLWIQDCRPISRRRWAVICSAKLKLPTGRSLHPSPSDHLVSIRRMLTEELYSDVVVIAKNKSEVKFHRSFMAAHSSVFHSMFQSGMAEAQSRIVGMRDMTEEAVLALREYLYLGKLEGTMEKARVCCDLLEAAHKYSIKKLEKIMEETFLEKPYEWYAVDAALRLFQFARARGEEGVEMKMKAARVLKARHGEFKALPSYQNLFKKNPDAAIDLYECLAKLK